jgi:hypothetical protein
MDISTRIMVSCKYDRTLLETEFNNLMHFLTTEAQLLPFLFGFQNGE